MSQLAPDKMQFYQKSFNLHHYNEKCVICYTAYCPKKQSVQQCRRELQFSAALSTTQLGLYTLDLR